MKCYKNGVGIAYSAIFFLLFSPIAAEAAVVTGLYEDNRDLWELRTGFWITDNLIRSNQPGFPLLPEGPVNFSSLTFASGLRVTSNYFCDGDPACGSQAGFPLGDRPVYGRNSIGSFQTRLQEMPNDEFWVLWQLPWPVTAFSIFAEHIGQDGAFVEVLTSTGWVMADGGIPNFFGPSYPIGSFYGLTSDTRFTAVRFRVDGLTLQSIEFFGPAQFSVPEPAAFLLMGTGLGFIFHLRRRRRPA